MHALSYAHEMEMEDIRQSSTQAPKPPALRFGPTPSSRVSGSRSSLQQSQAQQRTMERQVDLPDVHVAGHVVDLRLQACTVRGVQNQSVEPSYFRTVMRQTYPSHVLCQCIPIRTCCCQADGERARGLRHRDVHGTCKAGVSIMHKGEVSSLMRVPALKTWMPIAK